MTEAQAKELYTTKYAKKFVAGFQQEVSRLRSTVSVQTGIVGNLYRVPISGLREFQESSGGKGATPDIASEISTRWIAPKFYDDGEVFDRNFHYLSENADGEIDRTHVAMVAAAGRKLDQIVFDALVGTARCGDAGGETTAFPESQIIATDYTGPDTTTGGTGLTFAKIRKAKAMLKAAEAYSRGDTLYLVLSAQDIMDLLADDHATNAEFQTVKALDNGELNSFMGFNIIHSELLPTKDGVRQCLAYTKNALHLGIWKDVGFELTTRTDLKNCQQAYSCFSAGAVRVQDKGVVAINVA